MKGEDFRTQVKRLPGKPDIVFFRSKIAVFVHGCYWHRHDACAGRITPKSNFLWWMNNFNMQVLRDQKVYRMLRARGWWVYVAWQCEIEKSTANVVEDICSYVRQREN